MVKQQMARPAQTTREILAPLIRARGPISATELAGLLRVNRTTIGRTLRDFGDELVSLGATRSTRYLLRRAVRNIGNRWPIYRLGADGRAAEWAELEALHDGCWRVNWAGTAPEWAAHFTQENGLWSGFPFFLGNVRPQGFLGRAIARRISRTLQLPDDARQWSDEDILVYLQAAGEDLPGNQVIGDDCLRRALARVVEGESVTEADYAVLAVEIAQSLPGSSAGGEQPKFLATSQGAGPVLVKFSAPMDQATGRRWGDLLLCEFHAHQILAEIELAHPGARLLDADGRRFLEIPRFDRSGGGGRTGVVSLEALTAATGGNLSRDWTAAAADLHRRGLIDADSLAVIRRLSAFGELIGNSDMHFGNLAFFLTDTLPLRVTPAYDMLPMLWSPGSQGELIARDFAPAPPVPAMAGYWREAAGWAVDFWNRVAGDVRLSAEFVEIARQAEDQIRRMQRIFE